MARRSLSVLAVSAMAVGLTVAVAPVEAAQARPTKATLTARAQRADPIAASTRAALRTSAVRESRATKARSLDAYDAAAGRDGDVRVTATGHESRVAEQAAKLGGRAVASVGDSTSVVIPKNRVDALRGAPGVGTVSLGARFHTHADVSEGVAASGADDWQTDAVGNGGAGVTIGIVDLGFAGYETALPAGTAHLTNVDCEDESGTSTVDDDRHGAAVAEIVHEMAPGANLELYCIASNQGLATAADDIGTRGIKIVNMSLGISDDSRGDGTGTAGSAAATIAKSRRDDNVLWVVSAGNEAGQHWGGQLIDSDKDGYTDIDGPYDPDADTYENDVFFVAGTNSSDTPSSAVAELQWDGWPTTTQNVVLQVTGFQCTQEVGTAEDSLCGEHPITLDDNGLPYEVSQPTPLRVSHRAGTAPFSAITVANTDQFDQFWITEVRTPRGGYPTTRYDLNYHGSLSAASLLSCPDEDAQGSCEIAPRSYQQSVSVPANSPYALGVGATYVGAPQDNPETPDPNRGAIEQFSSQGPTIDGRTKPDISGWDGTTSQVYGGGAFFGTSAAAPHVAGAAALVKAADPVLDAAGVQRVLETRASRGTGNGITATPYVPPSNTFGAGLLTLGDPPTSASELDAEGSRYTAIAPTRVLDTRTTLGGHKGRVGANGVVTVPLPGIPGDVQSVAVNLTGVGATAKTFLTAFASGTAPATSNLNLAPGVDATAAVFAVVPVYRSTPGATPSIKIRNAGGSVDILVDVSGYFGNGLETGRLTSLEQPRRVLDTRTANGGHQRVLRSGETLVVDPDVGDTATAAVVDLTAASPAGRGFFSASATCAAAGTSSLLNYNTVNRVNVAVVPLDENGTFCLRNVGATTHALVDVVGYMSSAATGSEFFSLPSSRRIVDTRTGNGGYGRGKASAPFTTRSTGAFTGAGVGLIPEAATALLTGVTEASATGPSFLALVPGALPPASATSNLLFTANRVVPNAAVVGLANKGFAIYNAANTVHVAVDVSGYFAPVPND